MTRKTHERAALHGKRPTDMISRGGGEVAFVVAGNEDLNHN
jgi:hypothetical protein